MMTRPAWAFAAAFAAGLVQTPAPPPATGTALVAGQVIDATTRRPVGGPIVTLSAVTARPGPPATQPVPPASTRRGVAVADTDGRFVFRDVPAGSYALSATLEGYAPGATGRRRPGGPAQEFTVADGARVTDAVVTMWRLAAISGIVRDDRGEPAVGVTVWAMRRVMNAGRMELTFTGGTAEATDDRGHYRLANLMPGSYVVGIRMSTQSAAMSTVDAYQAAVTSGTTAAMMQDFSATGALQIESTGLTVGDWRVAVSIGMPSPLPGPSGTLLVHPAAYYQSAASPGQANGLVLAAGDDRTGIDLVLPLVPGVRVSGVLTGLNGPAANHGMQLVPSGMPEPVFDVPAAYATTDAAGRFAFLGVTPGNYVIRAYRVQSATPLMRPAPPAAGAPPVSRIENVSPTTGPAPPPIFAETAVTVGASHVDGLSVTLQPGARVSGRVAFEGAAPPPADAQLQRIALGLRPVTGTVRGASAGSTGTDVRPAADARFTTSGYPPGRYTIYHGPLPATGTGGLWELGSIRVNGVDVAGESFALGTADIDDVVVTFTDKIITLAGTVRAAETGAAADATVVAFPADYQRWLQTGMSPRRLGTAATTAAGSYQLRVTLPGDYLVVAVPAEIAPDVDRDFVTRFAASAVRVSLAFGDAKSQALTVRSR
jgi:protocatechuate 3,4-dioxygenase beta subunit